jgi:hypothetical protein
LTDHRQAHAPFDPQSADLPEPRGISMPCANPMENFQRDIRYDVRLRPDRTISLKAALRDCYHDIELEIVTDLENLDILNTRLDFHRAPSPLCDRVRQRLARLVGCRIGKGLSRLLSTTLGGPEGCGNLRAMLMGLLPLAINIRTATGIADQEQLHEAMQEMLAGTCAGFPSASDGEEQRRAAVSVEQNV